MPICNELDAVHPLNVALLYTLDGDVVEAFYNDMDVDPLAISQEELVVLFV